MTRFPTLAIFAAMTLPIAPAIAQTMPAKTFVMKAGASDLYEKQSSQLVLRTTHDAKVRSFATMMIADHTKSTKDVKAAAMRAKLTVAPPKLDAMQASDIAKLRKVSGSARDTLYWDQQKVAHDAALKLHQNYAADGSSAPLKAVAAATAPVVQHHIDMLNGAM